MKDEIPAFAGTDVCLPLASSRSKLSGWIILDKPSGITSAHAVGKVKRLLKPSKIGHAGTLDPLASGILPLALGEATKTVPFMMDAKKSYSFTATWGEERDTDDTMGAVIKASSMRPTHKDIEAVLLKFTGRISQIPPDYSAIKVDGERAYDMAREGKTLELKAREVTVYSLKLVIPSEVEGSKIPPQGRDDNQEIEKSTFICDCSKGTYIRSLARDMGRELGCLGHISQLRRLKVGNFGENHAISLEVMAEMVHKNDLSFLRPVESALDDIPACDASHDQAVLLKSGQTISLNPIMGKPGDKILVKSEGKLIAICEISQGSLMKPVRVFNL